MTRTERARDRSDAQIRAGGEKAVKRRVLQWLQQQQQSGAADAVAAVAVPPATLGVDHGVAHCAIEQPQSVQKRHAPGAEPIVVEVDTGSLLTPVDGHKVGARKKAAQLWKRWKAAVSMSVSKSIMPADPSDTRKLSQRLLQRHQQLLHSVDSTSTAAVEAAALHAAQAAGARRPPRRLLQHIGEGTALPLPSPPPPPPAAAATMACSSTHSTHPRTPTRAAAEAAAAGMPGNVVHAFNSSLYELSDTPRSVTPGNSTSRASVPSVDPAAAAAAEWLKASTAANGYAAATAWASALGHHAAAAAPAAGGAYLQPQVSSGSGSSGVLSPKTPGTAAAEAHLQDASVLLQRTSAATSSSGSQRHMSYCPSSSWGHSSTKGPGAALPEAASVRDSTRGPITPTQTPVANSADKLLGTALTAYPAVAAELARSCLGLEHNVDCVMQLNQPAARSSHAKASAALNVGNAPGSGNSNTPRIPAVASMSSGGTGPAADESDVSSWLLHAALLEDELQGRALEVQELLQQYTEQQVELQALLRNMDGARATQRHRITLELAAISERVKHVMSRAAALGSALSVLQGCQTVLSSNRGSKLDQSSKVAVVQLVMSEVVSRLPDEGLQQLEVCQGLPGLARPDEPDSLRMSQHTPAGFRPANSRLAQAKPANSRLANRDSIRISRAGREVCKLAGVGSQTLAVAHSSSSLASMMNAPEDTGHCTTAAQAVAAVFAAAGQNLDDTCDTVCYEDDELSQQQLPHPQQREWYRYSAADDSSDEEGGDDFCDDDDDVITTLSSVLSSRHYTPRRSLSYESRRAALAAARSGPWAASAPASPWTLHSHQLEHSPVHEPAAAAAAIQLLRRERTAHEGSFEVSLLSNATARSSSNHHIGSQAAQPLLASAAGASTTSMSLDALLASGHQAGSARRTLHMTVPLRSTHTTSSVLSDDDAQTLYSLKSAWGVAGHLAAWPEEDNEPTTPAACGPVGLSAFSTAQQQQQQQVVVIQPAGAERGQPAICGDGDMSRSSSTSCVTALTHIDEEDQMLTSSSDSSSNGVTHNRGAPVSSSGCDSRSSHTSYSPRAAPAATIGMPQAESAINSSTVAVPAGVDDCTTVKQLLAGDASVDVDLNSMTLGQLLQALTIAVVQRRN